MRLEYILRLRFDKLGGGCSACVSNVQFEDVGNVVESRELNRRTCMTEQAVMF